MIDSVELEYLLHFFMGQLVKVLYLVFQSFGRVHGKHEVLAFNPTWTNFYIYIGHFLSSLSVCTVSTRSWVQIQLGPTFYIKSKTKKLELKMNKIYVGKFRYTFTINQEKLIQNFSVTTDEGTSTK